MGVRALEANATGLSTPSCSCDRTASSACVEASDCPGQSEIEWVAWIASEHSAVQFHGTEGDCGSGVLRQKMKSSQVTFIYIALLTIQIVSKQLYSIKIGK